MCGVINRYIGCVSFGFYADCPYDYGKKKRLASFYFLPGAPIVQLNHRNKSCRWM